MEKARRMAWTASLWLLALLSPLLLDLTVVDGTRVSGNTLASIQRYALPLIAMALPFGLLRRWPQAALVLSLIGSVLVTVTVREDDAGYLADIRHLDLVTVSIVVGFVASARRRWVSVPAAVFALLALVAAAFGGPYAGPDVTLLPVLPLLATVTAWVIGNSIRSRRRYAEALREQAAAQAVTAERLRIARDLHDMVAHSIGIIAIQAGMGSRVIDTQPAEARAALSTIEESSRETLAGLRRVLVGLRRGDTGAAPVGPAPNLTDVTALAAATSHAGVEVEVVREGADHSVPPEIALCAYRIIQEALTNVVRHSGATKCQVTLEQDAEGLSVEVTDEGNGVVEVGTGYGIAGMRERVSLLHGEFSAAPRSSGGFRVAFRLPFEAAPLSPTTHP